MSRFRPGFPLLIVLLATAPAHAVIFYSTGDPAYNTSAPTGALTNSGWQYVGQWKSSFAGTVIASRYFITAKHIEAQVGDPFAFQGVSYTTLSFHDDPSSDLRICRVCGSFPPPFAVLHTAGIELNKPALVIGRGTQRGEELRVEDELKGWHWGTGDAVQRWGSNYISTTPIPGGPGLGDLLALQFNAGAGPDEAHLSYGDSGGPLFIKEGANWRLAGVNYAVEGPHNTTTNGPGFYAAIFDAGGLYRFSQSAQMWVAITNLPANLPTSFYSTRIATRVAWINSILNQAPPAEPPPVLQSAAGVGALFIDDPAAVVDPPSRTITVPAAGTQRFYRLRACTAYRISQISFNGSNVVITYE